MRRRFVVAACALIVGAGVVSFAGAAAAAAPANVTGLTATPLSASSVRLDWTNPTSTGFAGVRICRNAGTVAPTLPCNGVNVAKPTHTYTDSFQLLANTTYTYRVWAFNTSFVPASGASVTVTTLHGTAPGNVSALSATALSSASVRLDWTNPTNSDFIGVQICRAAGAVAPTLPCAAVNVAAPTHTYTDTFQLLANTQYTYAVFAYNSSGVASSGTSVTVTTSTAPPPPTQPNVTGLTATPLTATSVRLDWTNPTNSDFIGVRICRAAGAVAPTLPCNGVSVAAPAHTYTDTLQLLANTQYTYAVFAYNSSGAPSTGANVTVTTLHAPGQAGVTGLTATALSPGSVKLNWTNPTNSDFIGVQICRAVGTVAPTLPCAAVNVPTPGQTYTDTFGLISDTQYTYAVFAYNSLGVASSGTSVTVTTPPLI